MANTLVTPSIIAKESLTILENNLVLGAKVTRKFENQFVKIGSTFNVRRPNKYDVTSGPALNVQDTTESTTPITVDQQKHVDFNFTSLERTLVIEELSDRYLRPAMARLANSIDESLAARYADIPNIVGTPGVTPNNFNTSVKLTGLMLDLEAAPQDNRCLVLGPAAYWEIANGLQNLYVQSVSEPALKGYLTNIGNFEIYLDQNAPTHTVGNYAGTPIVGAAGQTGSSLATSGWTSGTLKKGDVITIAGVYGVNPQSRQSTGVLKNFVVTADTALSASVSIPIYPAITPTGRLQTVNASPAASAVITVKSGASGASYPQNLAFTPEAFGLVTVPLDVPQGVDIGARETYRDISMRVVRAYDINNDAFPTRVDILYGTATFYPEMCVRLTG